jgi:hypothetical protein
MADSGSQRVRIWASYRGKAQCDKDRIEQKAWSARDQTVCTSSCFDLFTHRCIGKFNIMKDI